MHKTDIPLRKGHAGIGIVCTGRAVSLIQLQEKITAVSSDRWKGYEKRPAEQRKNNPGTQDILTIHWLWYDLSLDRIE